MKTFIVSMIILVMVVMQKIGETEAFGKLSARPAWQGLE